jgi:hypothetical protein
MPMMQSIDEKRFTWRRRGYGNGFAKPRNNHPIYFYSPKEKKDGSFLNFIDSAKAIGNVISDNSETIQSVASTISKVADTGKAIADTIKVSKDLEKIKTIQQIRKKTKGLRQDIELTPEQEESLRKLGGGILKF